MEIFAPLALEWWEMSIGLLLTVVRNLLVVFDRLWMSRSVMGPPRQSSEGIGDSRARIHTMSAMSDQAVRFRLPYNHNDRKRKVEKIPAFVGSSLGSALQYSRSG